MPYVRWSRCSRARQRSLSRLKLCAGWITPEVVRDLEMDVAAYPHRFLTFERLHLHVKGVHLRVPCVQHSIRRYEFDAWLLERSGAPVLQHTVHNIRRENGDFVIDDAFRCRYLIGAAGTRCPVYRNLFRERIHARPSCRPSPWSMRSSTTGKIRIVTSGFSRKVFPGTPGTCRKPMAGSTSGIGGMAERMKVAAGHQRSLGAADAQARSPPRALRCIRSDRL